MNLLFKKLLEKINMRAKKKVTHVIQYSNILTKVRHVTQYSNILRYSNNITRERYAVALLYIIRESYFIVTTKDGGVG